MISAHGHHGRLSPPGFLPGFSLYCMASSMHLVAIKSESLILHVTKVSFSQYLVCCDCIMLRVPESQTSYKLDGEIKSRPSNPTL